MSGIKAPQRQIASASVQGVFDSLAVAATNTPSLGTFGLQTVVAAATVVRTRGYFNIATIAAGASSIIQGAFGLIFVSEDAFNAGIGSVPGPLTDDGEDWFVWEPIVLQNVSTDPHEVDGRTSQLTHFDSRGMRKTKATQVIAVVLELIASATGQSIDMGYSFRDQVKL